MRVEQKTEQRSTCNYKRQHKSCICSQEVSQGLSGSHRMEKSSSRGGKCSLLFSDVTQREDDGEGGGWVERTANREKGLASIAGSRQSQVGCWRRDRREINAGGTVVISHAGGEVSEMIGEGTDCQRSGFGFFNPIPYLTSGREPKKKVNCDCTSTFLLLFCCCQYCERCVEDVFFFSPGNPAERFDRCCQMTK